MLWLDKSVFPRLQLLLLARGTQVMERFLRHCNQGKLSGTICTVSCCCCCGGGGGDDGGDVFVVMLLLSHYNSRES